jgi:hypothetical protein
MAPEGKKSPDKKQIIILVALGLAILFVYKQMVLKPTPAPESAPAATGEVTDTAVPVESVPSTRANTTEKEFAVLGSTPEAAGDSSGQAWGRDPFVGAGDSSPENNTVTPGPVAVTPAKEEDLLELTGIAWYKNKALAVINGQVVHEGEYLYIKGKKAYLVISILKNRVLLKNDAKTITLRVRGG